jgi:hypothetical protein
MFSCVFGLISISFPDSTVNIRMTTPPPRLKKGWGFPLGPVEKDGLRGSKADTPVRPAFDWASQSGGQKCPPYFFQDPARVVENPARLFLGFKHPKESSPGHCSR